MKMSVLFCSVLFCAGSKIEWLLAFACYSGTLQNFELDKTSNSLMTGAILPFTFSAIRITNAEFDGRTLFPTCGVSDIWFVESNLMGFPI
jgi:hypothetical protein